VRSACFFILIETSPNYKLKERVKLEFGLAQHVRDEPLISELIKYMDCGGIYFKREVVVFRTTKLLDLTDKIIPFFKKYPILGVKSKDFDD